MLEPLAPHIASAFRNAQFIRHLTTENKCFSLALQNFRYGMLTLDSELNLENGNAAANELLTKYFASFGGLLETLRLYVEGFRDKITTDDFCLPHKPLFIKRREDKLESNS